MALLAAARQVLACALAILGAGAPQSMGREAEAGAGEVTT
jgi:hypothetical protein